MRVEPEEIFMRSIQTSARARTSRRRRMLLSAGTAGIVVALVTAPVDRAVAQDAEPVAERDDGEIFVTARKREENL